MWAVFSPLSLLLVPMVDYMCLWRCCYSLKEILPLQYRRDVTVPILYVQAKMGQWIKLSYIEGFYVETSVS